MLIFKICHQICCQKCTGVAISIENTMAGKTVGFVIHIRAVAKMSLNNYNMLLRQALPIKPINEHLSKTVFGFIMNTDIFFQLSSL